MRGKLCAVMLALSAALGTSSAFADETIAECASSYVQAQVLQRDGKYLEAAQTALTCAKPTCGDALSGECAKLYDVIQNATPSVVFAARDGDQNDLVNVQVHVDGKLVREKLDGSPLVLDPGVHVFRFEAQGLPTVEKPYTVRAGEKLRIVSEVLGEKRPTPKVDSTDQLRAPPPPPPSPSPRTLRIGGGVLAGVTALAGLSFGLLQWSGGRDYDALSASCKPHCTTDEVSGARSKYVFSYVSLGVGVAAAIGSVSLFALSAGKTNTAWLRVAPQTAGAQAQFAMTF